MSALGLKQTWKLVLVMSAIPSKADIAGRQLDVRFVPQTDSRTATSALFYFGCPMGVTR